MNKKDSSKKNSGINRTISSVFYKTALNTARNLAGKPARALGIVATATARLAQQGDKKGVAGLRENLWLLVNMIRAVLKKEYSAPTSSIVKALSAVVYFIFIVDAIPDFIPVAGLLDDLAVVAWVMKSLERDISSFKDWHYSGSDQDENEYGIHSLPVKEDTK